MVGHLDYSLPRPGIRQDFRENLRFRLLSSVVTPVMDDRVVRVRKLNSAIASLDLIQPIHLALFWTRAAQWIPGRGPAPQTRPR